MLLLFCEGVSQLKEKWTEYNQPKRLRRFISLFVSPRGKHVAIATGNQITILSKEDDYQEPCGIFIGKILFFYVHKLYFAYQWMFIIESYWNNLVWEFRCKVDV